VLACRHLAETRVYTFFLRKQMKQIRLYVDTGKSLKQVELIKNVSTYTLNDEHNLLIINGVMKIDLDLYAGFAVD
jgi:hypothetical protein